jgi:hypothetical protein
LTHPAEPAPRIWPGRAFVILASGPSLSEGDVETVRLAQSAGRVITIAINTTIRRAPWADVLYACDEKWWLASPEAAAFPGLKFGLRLDTEAAAIPGVRLLCYREPRVSGLESDPAYLATGGSSGYQAINLACHLGARRIVLLGFDCGADAMGRRHWHDDHAYPLRNPDDGLFAKWRQAFDTLPPALAGIGVEIVNCSRLTTIAAFARADLETTLRSI